MRNPVGFASTQMHELPWYLPAEATAWPSDLASVSTQKSTSPSPLRSIAWPFSVRCDDRSATWLLATITNFALQRQAKVGRRGVADAGGVGVVVRDDHVVIHGAIFVWT